MSNIHAAIGASNATASQAAGNTGAGGPRLFIPYCAHNIAAGSSATPSSSTEVPVSVGGAAFTGPTTMPRPGLVTGLSVGLTGAAAGSDAIFTVLKNGSTPIDPTAIVTTHSVSSDTKAFATFAGFPFVAGDELVVGIRTGTGWTATTVSANILLEILQTA